jgi:hypothetical protein
MVTSRPWPNPHRPQGPTGRRPPKSPARPSHARGGLEGILGKGICSAVDKAARARSPESLDRILQGNISGFRLPGRTTI